MKRSFFKLLFVLSVFVPALTAQAQLVNGIGIMGGVTYGRQKWFIHENDDAVKQKYLLRYNGEVFMEWFSHDNIRLVTELQYNMKGTKARETGERFKLDYFAFNNYLKLRTETYAFVPYVLVGPRVEYTFRSNEAGSNTLHFGWSAGTGFETVSYGPVCFLTELHYNPDINYAGRNPVYDYKNRAWELRVGLKFKFSDPSNDCP